MTAVMSLGSNKGDRLGFLRLGLSVLEPVAVSRVWETAPWGGVEQEDFLNVIALCPWDAGEAWRRAVLAEKQAGRTREVHWGPRTLDVDVVWADGSDEALELPHPRAHERAFVLVPWLDVDSSAVLPGHGPVASMEVDRSSVWLAAEQLA
ncbi:MAG: 2-amino-4-hydroxy-6-hydroxymethyldihydropteridine pyrophosphokinae [Frankiales bacterium]|nr:2-amino-4-hydroxy-6-hydroxymethyldihydropteridine pyrophosphokinae [Frankiales bacterium]